MRIDRLFTNSKRLDFVGLYAWTTVIACVICVLPHLRAADNLSDKDALKAEILPPCSACKQLVDSFMKGMERTARFKFDGGDAAWEEKNLRRYSESEVRLIEIQEHLCKDIVRGQNQCHKLASESEDRFERWWFTEQKLSEDMFAWFCIESLKVCCKENTFGPDCEPCPGGVENPCYNNGRCRGAGRRNGAGDCRCFKGYTGEACNECSVGFYESSREPEGRVVCAACHVACRGGCLDGEPDSCEDCLDGWLKHPELGCQDVDECYAMASPCATNEFCANTLGSYRCIECHSSCATCKGDAPDECTKCKDDYTRRGNQCIDSATWWRLMHTQWGRYLTYFGLCLATCIIFNRSTSVASIVGVAVATYIGVSEYVVSQDGDGDSSPVRFVPVSTA